MTRTRKLLAVVAAAALATGCVHVHDQFIGHSESGRPRYRISCSRSMDYCYERAAQLCHHGFDPVEGREHYGGVKLGDDEVHCRGVGNDIRCSDEPAPVIPTYSGSLFIECHGREDRRAARP